MLTEQGCTDAWSVLSGDPSAHAQQVIAANRRRRRLVMAGTIALSLVVLVLWLVSRPDLDRGSADVLGSGWALGAMGLALVLSLAAVVLRDRRATPAVQGTGPDRALPLVEQRALRSAMAEASSDHGKTLPRSWAPIAANVARRDRHEGWTIVSSTSSILLLIGLCLINPGLGWPLLVLALVLGASTIARQAHRAYRASRFLDRFPDADRSAVAGTR